MSLGLVVLEKKLLTRTHTRTPTPQSDDIKISTRDACNPQPGEIVFNIMRYRGSEEYTEKETACKD